MTKLSQDKELLQKLLLNGVKIIDPDSVYVEGNIEIGEGSIIYPQVFLANVKVGEKSTIGPVAQVIDTIIGNNAYIGFTAQIKRCEIGNNLKMHHHSYLGDAIIRDNVNISAGVITCNYDGKEKHKTIIEEDAFIGCNANLVAPIKIGKGCFIAAGSTLKSGIETGEGNLIVCREKEVYVRKLKVKVQSWLGCRID